MIMEHAIARIETEVRWHHMVLDRIGKLAADALPASTVPASTVRTGAVLADPVPADARHGEDRGR
jgi:hypothetical protein